MDPVLPSLVKSNQTQKSCTGSSIC
jgi:hypothetical protein